jgi:translocator protein
LALKRDKSGDIPFSIDAQISCSQPSLTWKSTSTMLINFMRVLVSVGWLSFVAAGKSPVQYGRIPQVFLPAEVLVKARASIEDAAAHPKLPTRKVSATAELSRGGACSDADAMVFLKIAASAALETVALLGVFYTGKEIAENADFGELWGLPFSQWMSLLFVVFGSSFLGSFVDGGMSVATQQALDPNVVPGDPKWYAKLKKPSWNPPGFVFPIMWLLVSKPTQALALSRVLKSSDAIPWTTLAVYCAHLSLGDAWNKVFFGYQCTGKGAAVITAFFGALLASAYLFFGVDPAAGKLMLPTCGWVFIASCLNWNIFLNN